MRRVRLMSLVLELAWTGAVSLGGGRSAYFYDSLVVRRGWLSSEQFVQDLTLSQILPGPNVSNLAVALGYRLGGWPGAAWGLIAVVLPGAVILLILAALYTAGFFALSAGGSDPGDGGGRRRPGRPDDGPDGASVAPWTSCHARGRRDLPRGGRVRAQHRARHRRHGRSQRMAAPPAARSRGCPRPGGPTHERPVGRRVHLSVAQPSLRGRRSRGPSRDGAAGRQHAPLGHRPRVRGRLHPVPAHARPEHARGGVRRVPGPRSARRPARRARHVPAHIDPHRGGGSSLAGAPATPVGGGRRATRSRPSASA